VKRERVVVSGIDGGLLDPLTHDHDPARPAVAALASLGIPLVLCSARTRAEVALLWRVLGLAAPVVVENGAVLLIPDGHLRTGPPDAEWDGEWHVIRLGPHRDTLRHSLEEAAAAAGVQPRLLSQMTPEDRRRRAALEGLRAPAGDEREYAEPFLLDGDAEVSALTREAEARGLRLARGQRFWYLCGGADKGLAVRALLALYAREGSMPEAIGLGAWPIDLPMLRAVHRPIILPALGGEIDPSLAAGLPRAERASQGGPQGWNDAVLSALARRPVPAIAAPPARSEADGGFEHAAS
jgi:mannosyl-3-phosphoglycerate phosphatase